SLQYLMLTRPDISFAVNKICQHMQCPSNAHFEALKRLLRYIQDADWAGDSTNRKSISGYCNYIGSSLVSWSVKKQTAVARSSTEAEYRALAAATAEVIWHRRLLQELNCSQSDSTPVFCENTSAIALANNP
ncbi:uncharacterized protein LOC114578810, partial [Dendrobium catenatum]|uniref:uncharacterized protein LOC114578810 n=1 Tax=Dendrobium catenatum TaxID=906689 RepID=UPI0010A082B5